MSEELYTITKNPCKPMPPVVRILGIRIKGNSLYIIIIAIVFGMLFSMATYQSGLIIAGIAFVTPPALAGVYVYKFIINKPRDFFDFWLIEKLSGARIRKR